MTTTDGRRFILICALGVILFFLYQAWQKDHPPVPVTADAAAPSATVTAPGDNDAPRITPADEPAAASAAKTASAPAAKVLVETDLFRGEISLTGGELRRLELKGYPVTKSQPDKNLPLLDDRNGHLFILQSGLASTDQALVTHESVFTSAQAAYSLHEGQDTLEVALDYRDAGTVARKIYRFKRGSYEVDLVQSLHNASAGARTVSPYVRAQRTLYDAGDEPRFTHTFKGVGFYEIKDNGGYRFRKEAFDKLVDKPIDAKQRGGWIALLQHYFAVAILPPADETHTFSAKAARGGYAAQYVGAPAEVAAGADKEFTTRLYLGPKLQNSIAQVAPGLELTVDYGILTPIAEPLFWLLDFFHKHTHNWGVAIILLTLAVKAALYKLSEAQYRSMAKMKKYGPRIQEIKERFGDDRERLQKAMMDLYKKEGFNPLAGCWPILIQFPVFISLYWVLLESVELRQASFAFWLNDLSGPDPYYVLPVLFGLSMWAQQKLSGQSMTMDPMQQKIMNAMPIMLTAFFAFFQSGLVLYWLVSNLIGIAQQWYITRKLEREAAVAR